VFKGKKVMESQLDQQIQTSFQKANSLRKKLEKKASRYIVAGIVLSALATFVTGVPSLMGQPIIGEWRLNCTIAALITLITTIVTSVQNQVAKPEILAKASIAQQKFVTGFGAPAQYFKQLGDNQYQLGIYLCPTALVSVLVDYGH
jgi:hypothetical protein